jgi:hypothetical protein
MKLSLSLLEDSYAVCRLEADDNIPVSLLMPGPEFVSISRSAEELSIVCPQDTAPKHAKVNGGWRAFKVRGPLDFSLTGVIATLTAPLAEARISVFTVATFDTDYLLVKQADLPAARQALAQFLLTQ